MMVFETEIKKFGQKGEKTGWTYIEIPAAIAQIIKPDTKTSFRVKGKLAQLSIQQLSVLPMGGGDFIIPLNAKIRKNVRNPVGSKISVELEFDDSPILISADFLDCLADSSTAQAFFETLNKGHQNYFSNWIEDAKTIETKSKRISMAVKGLSLHLGYPEMIRHFKTLNKDGR